jgi:hypothetical protein
MYLKGTQAQCKAYNKEVVEKENFIGSTTGYAKVEEHQNGVDFCILKHPRYKSDLEQIENLEGWFDNTQP